MRAHRFASAAVLLAALFASPSNAQPPALEIRVVPRIGLFNALQYQPPGAPRPAPPLLRPVENQWTPLSPEKYVEIVRKRNGTLHALLPPVWDMLTTDPEQAGYRARRVLVNAALGSSAAECALVFRNPRGEAVPLGWPGQPLVARFAANDCKLDSVPPVHSNEALSATLTYRSDQQSRSLKADVPEDFLIVSIGDSYAAGQGNPDGQCDGYFWNRCGDEDRALWMDERCHRSAQAATIQAGLKMIPSKLGAITIVSLACSGATLANGVVGPYAGQIDLTEFRTLNKDRGLVADNSFLEKTDQLPDQLTALHSFLDRQDAAQAKRSIDVLTMTIGGNDTGFAAALTDMILRRQSGATLAEVEAILTAKLTELRKALPEVRDRLQDLRTKTGYEVLQVLYTEYPDPTRVSADPEVFCADVPADGWVGGLASVLGFKLSQDETASAYRVVVQGLNRIVADLSADSAWRPVDGIMNDRDLVGRGWCAGGGTQSPKERWFRKVDESWKMQGNIAGAMHPT